jgi:hypothetical protein
VRVAIVPSAPALLPAYAGLTDPVADVRAAALAAVAWLGEPVRLVTADDLGRRVGEHLLSVVAPDGARAPVDDADSLLVVADGSARRGEKAPGHLDERAFALDAAIDTALRQGDPAALAVLDEALGAQLMAAGVPAFRALGALVGERRARAQVDYADDPFGVQYWVVRWEL